MDEGKLGRINWPTAIDPSVAEILPSTVFYRNGTPIRMFGALSHHAPAFHAVVSFGRAMKEKELLAPRERELMIIRIAALTDCDYETAVHTLVARERLGVTDEEIKTLQAAEPTANSTAAWSKRERALLQVTDDVCRTDTVSSTHWAAAVEVLKVPEIIEALAVIGYYRLLSPIANALNLAPDDIAL